MKRTWVKVVALTLALVICGAGVALGAKKAAKHMDVGKALLQSYDYIEKHQYKKAQAVLDKILKQDPGNPLALNNLAAIKVKEHKYPEALKYLEQALSRAKGYKIKVNQVCAADGICLAFRPLQEVYGDTDLAPLIKFNIDMVKARLATR